MVGAISFLHGVLSVASIESSAVPRPWQSLCPVHYDTVALHDNRRQLDLWHCIYISINALEDGCVLNYH